MKTTARAIVLSVALILTAGCGGSESGPTIPAGTTTPTITDVTPSSVTVGTEVTVTGTDFGASGQLFVNGNTVATSTWTDTSIVFTVPAGLTGTEIQLSVNNGSVGSATFAVSFSPTAAPPSITEVDPATLTEGVVVLIRGTGFGSTGELRINDDLVDTTRWTDTLIIFEVPQGLSGSQLKITVTRDGLNSESVFVPFFEATERQLTFDGMNGGNPCWSADGSTIYFEAQAPDGTRAFYQVPFLGGETTLLYNGPGNDRMLDVQYYQAGRLIWVSDELGLNNHDRDWEIREGLGGFQSQRFVDTNGVSDDTVERSPVWSHTEHLNVDCAWTQDRPGGNAMIYIRRISTAIPLVSGFHPCFDPSDGTYLAYLTWSGSVGYDVMKIRAEAGSTPEVIYSDRRTSHTGLAWGNGGQIAYMRNLSVWIMDDDGTNHRKLTDGHDSEHAPKFSPNGQWVTFTRLVTTESEIFVAKVPG